MSDSFKIAETETFQKDLKRTELQLLYKKIIEYVYPQLKKNPFYGINIKKLKGKFEEYYRYRMGNYRLFYKIDKKIVIIFIVTLKHRKKSYQ